MEIYNIGEAAITAAQIEALGYVDAFKCTVLNIISGFMGFSICALIVCIWALIKPDITIYIRRTLKKIKGFLWTTTEE